MTSGAGFTLFDTAIGRCGVAWREQQISACVLPDDQAAMTRRLTARACGAGEADPPTFVAAMIDRIVRLLMGEAVDLSDAPLDMTGVPDFSRAVYALALKIPAGQVRTYGDLARDLGDVALSRAVGRALGENPFPIIVPCHRILAANGKLGGFSAPGGADAKRRMLLIEGARRDDQPDLFG